MTVSDYLAAHCSELGARKGVFVVPNGRIDWGVTASLNRDDSSRTSTPGKPVVAYVGGASEWQCLPETIEIMKKLQEMDDKVDCRILTPGRLPNDLEVPDTISVGSLAPSEINQFLSQCTATFALRATSPVTLAASPIKVGEALSNGTGLIGTHATCEQMGELVDAGVAFDVTSLNGDMEKLLHWLYWLVEDEDLKRRMVCEEGERLLSLAHYKTELETFFGRLSGSPRHTSNLRGDDSCQLPR